jgi:hypothetical protein
MNVLLLQLDGKIPNLALMRIAAHHRDRGDEVELRAAGNLQAIENHFYDSPDKVYASAIFDWSQPVARRLKEIYPEAVIGGSGTDTREHVSNLAEVGITTRMTDYSIYPNYQHSIGYTQRGCRMNEKICDFCSVPWREGRARAEDNALSIWRGDPWPKHLLLLDNDTFGNPRWREEIVAIRDGGFKVCWNQGINARMLTDEVCEAIASVHYCDDQFQTRRIYTAWDNIGHERPLVRGIQALIRYGVKPDNIMVYMIVGHHDSERDREYRRKTLRDLGVRPYPMPKQRTAELVGFQRWIIGAYDKPTKRHPEGISWDAFKANNYRPEGVETHLQETHE